MRRLLGALVLVLLAIGHAMPAVAQEMEGTGSAPYMDPDSEWKQRRFRISAFGGNLSGSTSLGAVENIFFITGFDVGSGSLKGVRVGFSFAPRFEVEVEYARSSPGLNATLTDLRGQGKTEFEFADYDVDYLMAVVNYSVIERSRRIVPFLSVGIGTIGVSSDTAEVPADRKLGVLFGLGVRIRVLDILAIRADARGLRAGLGGGTQEEGALPGVLTGDFRGSNFTWTAGIELRF